MEDFRIGGWEELQDHPGIEVPAWRLDVKIEQALEKPMLQQLRIGELIIVENRPRVKADAEQVVT
jgi:hypothetical protein